VVVCEDCGITTDMGPDEAFEAGWGRSDDWKFICPDCAKVGNEDDD
jgi:hypothetical protein